MRLVLRHAVAGITAGVVALGAALALGGSTGPSRAAVDLPVSTGTPPAAFAADQDRTAERVERASRDLDRPDPDTIAAPGARSKTLGAQRAQIGAAADKAAKAEAERQRAEAERKRIEKLGYDPAETDPKEIARQLLANKFGYGADQFTCLDNIFTRESNWNVHATNPSSGAYGIPQSLPGNKMATVAADWQTNPATQITWGIQYLNDRYGSPCGGWGYWSSHHNY